MRTVFKVTGMHCPKCEARVEKAVGALAGVDEVRACHESDTCLVDGDGEDGVLDAVVRAIEAEGFTVEGRQ